MALKKWFWMLLLTAAPVFGQTLGYTPTPMGAFIGSGGAWTAWNATLGSQTLGYTPTPIGLYCSTNGTTWQPCNPSGGSGATLPFPGIVYATSAAGGTVATSPQIVTALNTTPSSTLAVALLPTGIPNANLATQTANTVLGALTATTPSGLAMPPCGGATNALSWTSGTGFGCNTITAGAGTVTAVSIATANGFSGSSSGGATPALTIVAGAITPTSTNGVSAATMAFMDATSSVQTQLNGKQASGSYALTTNPLSQFASTTSAQLAGVLSDETGTGVVVFSASPALTGVPTAPTAAQNANSTQLATTAYTDLAVSNAVAGVNPAVAVLAASTANVAGTYVQVGGGIGDTYTVTATGAFTLDGIAINAIGQRVLLKNQTSPAQNGVYTATIVGTTGISPVFTRALDYDTPSDVNNTGSIPVQSGTANTTTSWLLTSQVTSIGSSGSSLTYAQFSINPANQVLAVSPGVGIAHFAGSTQTVTSSAVNLASSDVTGLLPVASAGTGAGSFTAYAPVLGGTTTTGAFQSSVVGSSGQLFVSQGSSTKPTYIDFPERSYIPAANCNNTSAGAGWSIGSGGTAVCRAGTNNQQGAIQITDTSSTFAQFSIPLPYDWDTATLPYIRFDLAYPGTDGGSSHTIIPNVQVACTNGTSGTSDDPTFQTAHSSSTITLSSATANFFFSTSNVQLNSTDMTNCVAGSLMIVKVGRATDTATSAVSFYGATLTIPRQIVVQAN